MKAFETYVTEWEKNSAKDAYWAVLTSSQYEKTEWDREIFFKSGAREIHLLKEYIDKLQLPIAFQGSALDFGCGTGRLSQALAGFFSEVIGIDISANMVEQAKQALPQDIDHVKYLHNPSPNLQILDSEKFDFIYSNIVLQHIAQQHQLAYLKEFSRVIKKGGWIIIQTPSQRIFHSLGKKIKGRLIELLPYKLKKQILVNLLGNKTRALKEFDFEINTCSEKQIRALAQENRLEIKHIAYTNSCEPDFCGNLAFLSYAEASHIPGYLSPMYFMQKF